MFELVLKWFMGCNMIHLLNGYEGIGKFITTRNLLLPVRGNAEGDNWYQGV